MKAHALAILLLSFSVIPCQGEPRLTAEGEPIKAPRIERPDAAVDSTRGWHLVNDGSFEFGECGVYSDWTCTTNTTCSWIVDPLPTWGYPAYEGELVAWLGGFCGGANSNSFCQDIYLWTPHIRWHWMGYVGETNMSNFVYVRVNGDIVWAKEMVWPEDHTFGTWVTEEITWDYLDGAPGVFELCFEFEASSGANMLIDYIEVYY